MFDFDPHQIGGGALVLGFVLVLAALYRNPTSGLAAATADPQSLFYFLVLPVVGLLAGGYSYLGGPFNAIPLFLLGSYLGVFGLALTFGTLLAPDPFGILLGLGLLLLTLSVVALVASVKRLAAFLQIGTNSPLSD